MQIVIDISKEKYDMVRNKTYCGIYDAVIYKAIANGTVLPKGHGDLIDKNKLSKKKQYLFKTDNGAFPKSEWFIKADDLFSAKAIIRADKEKRNAYSD